MSRIEDPNLEGVAEKALEEPGPDGLTPEQFSARLAVKREQAAQDAGWVQPPGPDEEIVDAEAAEPPAEEDADPDAPEDEDEQPEGEEETPDEEDPDADAEQDAEDFYVGRYRTREDAEAGIAEQKRTIDRLYREMHEQREQRQQQVEQPQQQVDPAAWNQWAVEAVENGAGERGAMEALQTGGQAGYDIYAAHWMASEDPAERAQAVAFNNEVTRAYAEQRAIAAVAPLLQDRQQAAAVDEAEHARAKIAARHEDFGEYEDEMNRLIEEEVLPLETRQMLHGWATSGLEGKVAAWDYLYAQAKASAVPRREQARTQERARRRTSGDAAKVAATVSSSEATPTRTTLTESERAVIGKKNELRKEWNLPLLDEE